MENSISLIKDLIQNNRYIEISELICSTADTLIESITTDDLLNIKEHPNQENITRAVELYEEGSKTLIELVAILIKYSNIKENENYQETIKMVFDKLVKDRKNETDGYGYIWKHLSNYPLMLLSYSTNIMLMKKNEYEFLYKLMSIPYKQRYVGYDMMKSFDITLPEAMNCYHMFNDIDYVSVNIYQYLPGAESKKTNIQNRLVVNGRVYKYLSDILVKYFVNESDFDEYFDLYEYFLGLFYMDQRLSRYEKLPDRQTGEFAPYGRRYWLYSESGRFFNYKDSIVHNFIQETTERKNNILNSGFFEGKSEKFSTAYEYYRDLLRRITGY